MLIMYLCASVQLTGNWMAKNEKQVEKQPGGTFLK